MPRLTAAKSALRDGALTAAKPCRGTLEELIKAYRGMPKRAGVAAASVAEDSREAAVITLAS